VRLSTGLQIIPDSEIEFNPLPKEMPGIVNLNTFSEAKFNNPPKKNPKAKFRRHPFKDGNMTVALTNFNPRASANSATNGTKWHSSVFLGAGKDFKIKAIRKSGFKRIGKLIESQHRIQGAKFINEFEKRFQKAIGNTHKFQEAYVGQDASGIFEPRRLIEEIGHFIAQNEPEEKHMNIPDLIPGKERIPTRQVFAMYAINRIIS
jgi:DNA (cytosine-5)-methyltransferase 1